MRVLIYNYFLRLGSEEIERNLTPLFNFLFKFLSNGTLQYPQMGAVVFHFYPDSPKSIIYIIDILSSKQFEKKLLFILYRSQLKSDINVIKWFLFIQKVK